LSCRQIPFDPSRLNSCRMKKHLKALSDKLGNAGMPVAPIY
jgi:hypothetical protein